MVTNPVRFQVAHPSMEMKTPGQIRAVSAQLGLILVTDPVRTYHVYPELARSCHRSRSAYARRLVAPRSIRSIVLRLRYAYPVPGDPVCFVPWRTAPESFVSPAPILHQSGKSIFPLTRVCIGSGEDCHRVTSAPRCSSHRRVRVSPRSTTWSISRILVSVRPAASPGVRFPSVSLSPPGPVLARSVSSANVW